MNLIEKTQQNEIKEKQSKIHWDKSGVQTYLKVCKKLLTGSMYRYISLTQNHSKDQFWTTAT